MTKGGERLPAELCLRVLESLPQRIFVKDRRFVYLWSNLSYAGSLGVVPADLVGKTDYDFYPRELAERYRADDARVISSRSPAELDEDYPAGGRLVRVHTTKTPLVIDGEVIGVVGIFWTAAASEPQLAAILRAAPIAIGMVQQRVILEGNQFLFAMLGYARDDLIGQSARVLYPTQEEFERVGVEKYGQMQAHGTGVVETQWRRKDGAVIDVLLSSTPLYLGHPEAGVTFTALDITESKRAREVLERDKDRLAELVAARTQELERAHAQLLEKERLVTLGRLTATVSHELRNPLGVIANCLFLLRRKLGPQAEKFAAPLTRAESSVRRADDIIRELLEFAAQPGGEREPTRIDEWLRETLAERELEPAVELTLELGTSAVARIHREAMRRALWNVVDNAVHAMRDGKTGRPPRLHVSLRVAPQAELLEIAITDNGPGIPPEVLPRVLEPLFSTRAFGVGLGLSIVQQILRHHGGDVHVESTPGVGATVVMALPRALEGGIEGGIESGIEGGMASGTAERGARERGARYEDPGRG